MMEGAPMVSYSRGWMNSLLHKLTELNSTSESQGLPPAHVEGLLQALQSLNVDLIDKVTWRQETDWRVKVWMKQVRQLVVDIEDWIDPKLKRRSTEESENKEVEDRVDPELATANTEEPEKEEVEDRVDPELATTNTEEPENEDSEDGIDMEELMNDDYEDKIDMEEPVSEDSEDGIDMEEPENENLEDFMTNDEIFEDFMTQIDEARERCTRYELLNTAPTDSAVHVDVVPRQLLLEEKPVGLVGVDGPIETIVKKLTFGKKRLKVVSIVGTEGLGKTTLAKEIYAKLHGKFDCQAFVSVGRRTPVSTTLMEILLQLRPGWMPTSVSNDTVVIRNLRECLDTKRYLIIIDGIWSTQDWKVINCALPENNLGSRVLTTTCIMNVANPCSVNPSDVIQMKALSRIDSEEILKDILGMKALRGVESKEIFVEKADEILKICGGVPLAIIVAAGFLSMKSADLAEPRMIGKSDCTSVGMTKILYMSYADLSVPLKSCFMYLSVFPEDYTIKKDRLIQLWRAEGFIPTSHKESMWETGERYFNELIGRRLIQPVFSYEDDQAVGCTIHGVVLDFMASLSREENFVTVGAELKPGPLKRELPWSLTAVVGAEWMSKPFLCYETVQRLSLHAPHRHEEGKSDNFVSCHVHPSRVRSVIAFGDCLYSLWLNEQFRLIRVLDLEDATNTGITSSRIGNLFLLRYLGLAGTYLEEIENIGGLVHLQTLDIRETSVRELPSGIHLMPNLVSVLGDGLCFSGGSSGSLFENVQNLEELSTIDVTDRTTRDVVAKLLIGSKKLRRLGVCIPYPSNTEGVMPFLDELRKYNLESLVIDCVDRRPRDGLGGIWAQQDELPPMDEWAAWIDKWAQRDEVPPMDQWADKWAQRDEVPPMDKWAPWMDKWAPWFKLRRFQLINTFLSRVPESWASLDGLTHLDISIIEIGSGDLFVLGKLRNLIILKLHSQSCQGSGCIVGSVGFGSLEVAWIKCPDGGMGLHFQDNAMPKLRKLRLEFNAGKTMKKHAIGKFPSNLMQVDVTINCECSSPTDVKDAEQAIRDKLSDHPRKPNLSFELIPRVEKLS